MRTPLGGDRRVRRGDRAPAHHARSTHRRGFRPDVEGLRAVAVVLVVLYHCQAVIPGGYVGVDVFFVISGFLITCQLLDELMTTGRISLPGFYARRARRILPAATLTTIVTVVLAGLLLPPLGALRVFSDARAAALFGANIHFASLQATISPPVVLRRRLSTIGHSRWRSSSIWCGRWCSSSPRWGRSACAVDPSPWRRER